MIFFFNIRVASESSFCVDFKKLKTLLKELSITIYFFAIKKNYLKNGLQLLESTPYWRHQCSTLLINILTHFHFQVLVAQHRISLKMPNYLVLASSVVLVHSGELFFYLSFSCSPGTQRVAIFRKSLLRASQSGLSRLDG